MGMKLVHTDLSGFQDVLEHKQAELIQVLRVRDDITIEKSADQMDEIQYASERDLAIRNVDRGRVRARHDRNHGRRRRCILHDRTRNA